MDSWLVVDGEGNEFIYDSEPLFIRSVHNFEKI